MDVPYIFGNPGTTELPLVDGCNDYPSVQYVLSLHEDVAVAQAMGYARASGRVGVVNLHVTPGVAHGLGNLYNAYRARVPLLVTAGQHHPGLNVYEPILTSDLAGLVRPFTKWAYEVTQLEELPVALQRAFKELSTPPYGPVFLSLPTNLLLEKFADPPPVRVSRVAGVGTEQSAVEQAADALTGAAKPVILAGDGVGLADAWHDVAALAETLGAVVYTEGYATSWNFPPRHPQYGGPMSIIAAEMRKSFDDVDLVLMCGVTSQAPVSRYDEGGPLIPWRVRTISVDDSSWEVGKNQPVEIGLVGDVARNLSALRQAVQSKPVAAEAEARRKAAEEICAKRTALWQDNVAKARGAEQISPTLIAAELGDRLPAGAVFVDESISSRASFVNVLDFTDPASYFAVNGLSLGYSTGAAVGIQLALPDRQVVNVVGDGSLLYYPQALWNAASAQTPILFVVLNNASYNVLKVIIDRMGGPWGANGQMTPGLDIVGSRVGFVELAASMGVSGERAESPAELRAALDRGLDASAPYLVEVILEQG